MCLSLISHSISPSCMLLLRFLLSASLLRCCIIIPDRVHRTSASLPFLLLLLLSLYRWLFSLPRQILPSMHRWRQWHNSHDTTASPASCPRFLPSVLSLAVPGYLEHEVICPRALLVCAGALASLAVRESPMERGSCQKLLMDKHFCQLSCWSDSLPFLRIRSPLQVLPFLLVFSHYITIYPK